MKEIDQGKMFNREREKSRDEILEMMTTENVAIANKEIIESITHS